MNQGMMRYGAVFGMLATLQCACITIKAQSVDEKEYLGQRSYPADIYGRPASGTFYSLLDGFIDPMDRLMLVDFDGDPDYTCLELQILDSPQRGKGAVVLLYRTDGAIDLYHTPGLDLTGGVHRLVSPGVSFVATNISYGLDVTDQGTIGRAQLKDLRGRTIEVFMRTPRKDRPTGAMLAPLGDIVKSPEMFPFFFIHALDFAPREGSEIRILVDGKARKPATIPLWVNGTRVYLARYSLSPAIGIWNRAAMRAVQAFPVQGPAPDGGKYELKMHEGHAEISRVTWSGAGHAMSFAFSPPLPDLGALRTRVTLDGRFSGGMDAVSGVFAGEYRIDRNGEQITMEIHPTEGWQPQFGRLWLASYHWKAIVTLTGDHAQMRSGWWRD